MLFPRLQVHLVEEEICFPKPELEYEGSMSGVMAPLLLGFLSQ